MKMQFVMAFAMLAMTYGESVHADAQSFQTLTMGERRAAHTATLLRDGRVLIAGGFRTEDQPLASVELFDPRKNAFTPTGDMTLPRVGHVAVPLPDGRVLIAGGWSGRQRVASAEIYDPVRGTFIALKPMRAPRADLTATLLRDGRVALIGGFSARNTPNLAIEVFDPRSNTFVQVGMLAHARSGHTATLLRDGTVLIVGGTSLNDDVLRSAEVFDPATNAIMPVGDLGAPRRKHAAARLADGRVIVIGGSDGRDWTGQYGTTEIYDPKARAFTPGPRLNATRFKLADAVAALRDGSLVVGGGNTVVERFDGKRLSFSEAAKLPGSYYFATATPLGNGSVLIAGGYDDRIAATDGAWVFSPR
jgi:hypothetical protein